MSRLLRGAHLECFTVGSCKGTEGDVVDQEAVDTSCWDRQGRTDTVVQDQLDAVALERLEEGSPEDRSGAHEWISAIQSPALTCNGVVIGDQHSVA